ncbi:hypothetical protein ACFSCX_24935 [Bacillus salitolerans]|uniref:Uncharacterized protein n=1 Tax=Bacillus salitolerans TaxID=1437434 RepID=A0ABW4LX97_9BACI
MTNIHDFKIYQTNKLFICKSNSAIGKKLLFYDSIEEKVFMKINIEPLRGFSLNELKAIMYSFNRLKFLVIGPLVVANYTFHYNHAGLLNGKVCHHTHRLWNCTKNIASCVCKHIEISMGRFTNSYQFYHGD